MRTNEWKELADELAKGWEVESDCDWELDCDWEVDCVWEVESDKEKNREVTGKQPSFLQSKGNQ